MTILWQYNEILYLLYLIFINIRSYIDINNIFYNLLNFTITLKLTKNCFKPSALPFICHSETSHLLEDAKKSMFEASVYIALFVFSKLDKSIYSSTGLFKKIIFY